MDWKTHELIICDSNLTNSDIQKVETYLARKWGLTIAHLPSSHPGRTTPLASWSIKQGALESNEITLNFRCWRKVPQYAPTNDDKWHHITTTFGGGNKKRYIWMENK